MIEPSPGRKGSKSHSALAQRTLIKVTSGHGAWSRGRGVQKLFNYMKQAVGKAGWLPFDSAIGVGCVNSLVEFATSRGWFISLARPFN